VSVPIQPLTTGKLAFLAGSGGGFLGSLDVYVADRHGGRPVRLTPRPLSYTAPAWSPDGSRLAYAESFGEFGGGRIWTADPATRQRRMVLETEAVLGGDLTWSPDGRWLGYYASTGTLGTGSV
jgi:Tol biopolymer transport system component